MLQLLAKAQRQTARGLPLAARDGVDTTAPDFREEGAGVQRERQRGGKPGRGLDAEQRNAEVGQEQLHQQRRALEDLDIDTDQPVGQPVARDTQHQQRQTDQAAADEGNERQADRPAGGAQQVAQDVPEGEFNHGGAPLSGRRRNAALPS